jgi:superfamily II DNA or RNA helicase
MTKPSDIFVTKLNEVHLQIHCERHVARELAEFFSFYVPGYKFSPAFKNKLWNGKTYLYSLTKSTLYVGLLEYLKEFAKEAEYTIEFGEGLNNPGNKDASTVKEFCDSLNLHSDGKPISIKGYQVDAITHGLNHRRALLLSPTASGKSLVIYSFVRVFKKLKGLIVVPSLALTHQLKSDFEDYSSHNSFDADENVHLVYQGTAKTSDKPLTISTWQSIYKEKEDYFKQFDYVIVDEAHTMKSDSITGIMSKCVNAKYRIGLTGTLDGSKTHKLIIEGLTGPQYVVTTTAELQESGDLSPLEIKCIVLKHDPETCKSNKSMDYDDEITYLCNSTKRNKFIKNLTLSMKTNTLVLFRHIDHGKLLHELISTDSKIGNRNVYLIWGGVDVEERERIRKILETENDSILIASFGTFSQGNNVKNLHNIIFASAYKTQIKTLQSIGRSLRLHKSKDVAFLYDIADDLRYEKRGGNLSKNNHTLNHFIERIAVYNNEKFKYKTHKVDL